MIAVPTLFIVCLVALAPAAAACSRFDPVVPEDMVEQADIIVRATAISYVTPPSDPRTLTSGELDSVVRFRIEEILKGPTLRGDLELHGYLSDKDDFNELDVPYRFVRRGGRSGSCFASTYRFGAEHLLFLKRVNNRYAIDWYALGPTNEQLKSTDDRWLIWVRTQILAGKKKSAA